MSKPAAFRDPPNGDAETVRTNLRVPADLYAELKGVAAADLRSVNSEIIVALRRHVEEKKLRTVRSDA